MADKESWERREDETVKAWQAFTAYRDLGKTRTLSLAAKALGRRPVYIRVLEKWSSQNEWVKRCRDYDAFIDRIQQEALVAQTREQYLEKRQSQKADYEKVGRVLVSVSLRMIQILQVEVTRRLREPEPMKASEMAAILKAATFGIEVGNDLIDKVIDIEAVDVNGVDQSIEEILDIDSPEALAREYRRLLDASQ